LLGLVFLVFGLNGFLHFIPQGPIPAGPASQFLGTLSATNYMVPVFAIEIISAVLFLAGRYVPLALTLIAPVIVNILLFHALMMPSTVPPAILVTVLWLLVFVSVRSAFAGILQK
jgi:hypothetical protein